MKRLKQVGKNASVETKEIRNPLGMDPSARVVVRRTNHRKSGVGKFNKSVVDWHRKLQMETAKARDRVKLAGRSDANQLDLDGLAAADAEFHEFLQSTEAETPEMQVGARMDFACSLIEDWSGECFDTLPGKKVPALATIKKAFFDDGDEYEYVPGMYVVDDEGFYEPVAPGHPLFEQVEAIVKSHDDEWAEKAKELGSRLAKAMAGKEVKKLIDDMDEFGQALTILWQTTKFKDVRDRAADLLNFNAAMETAKEVTEEKALLEESNMPTLRSKLADIGVNVHPYGGLTLQEAKIRMILDTAAEAEAEHHRYIDFLAGRSKPSTPGRVS